MFDGARAQQASGQRLPVTVNGKRVKTIDVHAHCLFHEAEKLMGSDNAAFTATVKGAPQAFITLDERLKAMDAMAVDMEVLSINPFWYRKERDLAAEIVRVQNDKLAELCPLSRTASLPLRRWPCSFLYLISFSTALRAL